MKEDTILGPFDINEIAEFVHSGLILKRDYAYDIQNPDTFQNVDYFLKQHGVTVSVEHKGGLVTQIKAIGQELIIPPKIFTKEPWQKDKKLFILALVGLGLSFILTLAPILPTFAIFYIVSLYFSVIWGLFFYYLFKTEQVKLSTTLLMFFGTQIIIILAYYLLDIGQWNPFNELYNSPNSLVALVSCILGIGCVEEFIKVIPVLWIIKTSKYVVHTQTAVFYGLISGIAFGVFEGIQYQLGPNYQALIDNGPESAYVYSYLSNLARLTSLPFLHAVWCGIASYFIGFAFLYPRFRVSLFLLAILIPATIHGLYDFLCFNVEVSFVTIPVILIGVVLLMVYLNIRYNFHSKLMD